MLLTLVLPENEHEELCGDLEETYWKLMSKHHSKTDAMMRTSWKALRCAIGMCFDNILFKTGSFKEEALRIKDFFSKLFVICSLLIFPVLYFPQGTLTLFILFVFILMFLVIMGE
ncbi:MAG: hypothetical protein NVS2B14_02180 [Chamaesiphon sp.]